MTSAQDRELRGLFEAYFSQSDEHVRVIGAHLTCAQDHLDQGVGSGVTGLLAEIRSFRDSFGRQVEQLCDELRTGFDELKAMLRIAR